MEGERARRGEPGADGPAGQAVPAEAAAQRPGARARSLLGALWHQAAARAPPPGPSRAAASWPRPAAPARDPPPRSRGAPAPSPAPPAPPSPLCCPASLPARPAAAMQTTASSTLTRSPRRRTWTSRTSTTTPRVGRGAGGPAGSRRPCARDAAPPPPPQPWRRGRCRWPLLPPGPIRRRPAAPRRHAGGRRPARGAGGLPAGGQHGAGQGRVVRRRAAAGGAAGRAPLRGCSCSRAGQLAMLQPPGCQAGLLLPAPLPPARASPARCRGPARCPCRPSARRLPLALTRPAGAAPAAPLPAPQGIQGAEADRQAALQDGRVRQDDPGLQVRGWGARGLGWGLGVGMGMGMDVGGAAGGRCPRPRAGPPPPIHTGPARSRTPHSGCSPTPWPHTTDRLAAAHCSPPTAHRPPPPPTAAGRC
jgi:hypothetical protein